MLQQSVRYKIFSRVLRAGSWRTQLQTTQWNCKVCTKNRFLVDPARNYSVKLPGLFIEPVPNEPSSKLFSETARFVLRTGSWWIQLKTTYWNCQVTQNQFLMNPALKSSVKLQGLYAEPVPDGPSSKLISITAMFVLRTGSWWTQLQTTDPV